MPAGSGPDGPISVARFSLTIDGVEIAQFAELVSITSEAEPDDVVGKALRKLPGKRKPPTVTLRRGLTADTQLAAWHDKAIEGGAEEARKNAELVMFAADGSPVVRYHLENAWPSALEVGPIAGGGLAETIVLRCQRARRVAP